MIDVKTQFLNVSLSKYSRSVISSIVILNLFDLLIIFLKICLRIDGIVNIIVLNLSKLYSTIHSIINLIILFHNQEKKFNNFIHFFLNFYSFSLKKVVGNAGKVMPEMSFIYKEKKTNLVKW